MSLKKILAQKLKHPKTKEWIETSYIVIDDATSNDPIIYMHGTLADNNVIEGRHIQEDAITSLQLGPDSVDTENLIDIAVTRPKIRDEAINSNKLATDAVVEDKIFNGAVTENKLGTNAVTKEKIKDGEIVLSKLSSEVQNFIKEASNSVVIASEQPSDENVKIWIKI